MDAGKGLEATCRGHLGFLPLFLPQPEYRWPQRDGNGPCSGAAKNLSFEGISLTYSLAGYRDAKTGQLDKTLAKNFGSIFQLGPGGIQHGICDGKD